MSKVIASPEAVTARVQFTLPFPIGMQLTIEEGCSIDAASEGIIVLADICDSIEVLIAEKSDQPENLGHANRMLLSLIKEIATAINHGVGGGA